MAGNEELRGDREPLLNERERLSQILVLFGRHGIKGLAGLLGIGQGREEPLENARPEAVVALMRDLGPVAVKFGQLLAMRRLEPEWPLSTPGLVGQLERFARTGTVPVSVASSDLERLRSGQHGRRDGDPNVLPPFQLPRPLGASRSWW